MLFGIISSLYWSIISLSNTVEDPFVCLESGTCYQGGWFDASPDFQFASFQGIKYANDPTGPLRFKPPQPIDEMIETIDVSAESKVQCVQDQGKGIIGQEDCLTLNIYIPEKIYNDNSGTKYPVMFWIYGGGFWVGDGTFYTYGPQPLMNKDVILVTINYRLGRFGFLALDDSEVSGNAGMMDQNLALKWVQNNIGRFGGDPDSVTIFGESAGSLSVALHVSIECLLHYNERQLFRNYN